VRNLIEQCKRAEDILWIFCEKATMIFRLEGYAESIVCHNDIRQQRGGLPLRSRPQQGKFRPITNEVGSHNAACNTRASKCVSSKLAGNPVPHADFDSRSR
jgi:hypothetical protein